jgi:AcrR family transcriptional regulator
VSRAGLSRAAVVAAAADLADERGLRHVTVSEVARRLGVRPPSIYSHLPGAEDLQAGVSLLALEELADRVDVALAGRSGHDALTALAAAHRTYAAEHPGRYDAAGVLTHPVTPELARAGRRHADQAGAVLRGYDVPADQHTHAVRLIAGVLRGFVQLEAGGAFAHTDPEPEASWRWVLAALDATLRPPGEDPHPT